MDRVRRLTKELEDKIERYEELAKAIGGRGVDYSSERVQTSTPLGSSMETALIEKQTLEAEIEKTVHKLKRWRRIMADVIIASVDDKEARNMALIYYVDNQSYRWIARFFNLDGEKGKERVRTKCRYAKKNCISHLSTIKW